MAIEIVDFPIKNGDSSIVMWQFTRLVICYIAMEAMFHW